MCAWGHSCLAIWALRVQIARAMQDTPLGGANHGTNLSEHKHLQVDPGTIRPKNIKANCSCSPCPCWQVSASLQGVHRMGCPCRLVMWHGHCPSTRCWRWCCAVWHVQCGSFRLHRGSLPMAWGQGIDPNLPRKSAPEADGSARRGCSKEVGLALEHSRRPRAYSQPMRMSDDPSHRHAAHHMLTLGATLSGKCASSRVPHPRSCGVHIV